jgi:hypothetical protein
MTIGRTIITALLMAFAAYIVVMNWGCMIVSLRNQRKGIDKHHSMVPIFSILVALVAVPIYPHSPKWWIGIVPLLDISNWNILRLPFILMAERKKENTEPEN